MTNVEIIIDSRETALYNELINRDLQEYKDLIKFKKEQLELADIHIKFNNDENIFVYERKTVRDLLNSLSDKRYKEQKERLISNYNNINYIIEGDDIISSKSFNNQNILTSIYLHSIYRDNINVFFTKNINETATFILIIATKISKNYEKFISKKIDQEYIDICKIKSKKISNIDKKTCYLLQLSQIPTISKEIAKNIKEKYENMKDLLDALNDTDEKINLLKNIKGIGENKAKMIIEYLCN